MRGGAAAGAPGAAARRTQRWSGLTRPARSWDPHVKLPADAATSMHSFAQARPARGALRALLAAQTAARRTR